MTISVALIICATFAALTAPTLPGTTMTGLLCQQHSPLPFRPTPR